MNKPSAGLRRLHNKSNQIAKVQINVAPGDELEVSDDVAAQLTEVPTSAFGDGPAPKQKAEDKPAEDKPEKKTPAKKAPAKK